MSLVDLLKFCDTFTPEIYIYEENHLSPFFVKGSYELLAYKDLYIYNVVSIRCITSLSIIVVVRYCDDGLPFC